MPILRVDTHEPDELVASLRERMKTIGVEVEVGVLATSDMHIGNVWAGERKTPEDFCGSIKDSRIWAQATEMRQNFAQCFILIDGTFDDVVYAGLTPNAMYAAIASLNIKYGVPTLFVGGHFTQAVEWLVRKALDDRPTDYTPIRKSASTGDMQLHFVSSLPGIGTSKAKEILRVYKTPMRAFAEVDSWPQKVDGIGKVTAERVSKVLGGEAQ